MTTEEFNRKLTAILSADVEGYSRLMGEDEDATIRTLTTYRELMSTLIQKHRGRVVDSPGDNLLAEFGSVVDAVRCAVEIQEELRIRNAELPDNRKMHFRIGINLGDVVEEGERIYGDGINIAARVDGLAEGGGICISGTVYDSIKNKLSLSYEPLGEHSVKNIKEPVRVYRMRVGPEATVPVAKKIGLRRWQWAALTAVVIFIIGAVSIWNFYFRPPPFEPASLEKMAFPLPEKPSIAVLPFFNLSGKPEDEMFSDGLTEEIITALSKMPGLFVIARNSTFTYKGKPVKVQQVAEELGVQYVLEGSVLKGGDKIRITAQLIDALTGRHLWAERYDQDLSVKNIFEIHDAITVQILKSLRIKIRKELYGYKGKSHPQNLEASIKSTKASQLQMGATSLEEVMMARQLHEEAIALDPDYSGYYVGLAWNYHHEARFSKTPQKAYERGIEAAKKLISFDETGSHGYVVLARHYAGLGLREKAEATFKKAMSIDPNNPEAYVFYAWYCLRPEKRFEEAINYIEKAKRLNPFPDPWYYSIAGALYMDVGNWEKAIPELEQHIKKRQHLDRPVSWDNYLLLTQCLLNVGREDEAYAAATELLKIKPNFDLERFLSTANNAAKDRLLAALHKAGLLKKEEEAPESTAMKWKSNEDGFGKDGVFTRNNPPTFSFEYPADFVKQPLQANDIYRIRGPATVNVQVGEITTDLKQFHNKYVEGYKKALENLGTDVKIIYSKPLPLDTYGEEFPSQEFEIEWMYAGSTFLTSYINVIVKDGYFISMQGHTAGDIDEVKAIFETIDLEP
jgi:TolB-like protein/class 3 adenylate cyclase